MTVPAEWRALPCQRGTDATLPAAMLARPSGGYTIIDYIYIVMGIAKKQAGPAQMGIDRVWQEYERLQLYFGSHCQQICAHTGVTVSKSTN